MKGSLRMSYQLAARNTSLMRLLGLAMVDLCATFLITFCQISYQMLPVLSVSRLSLHAQIFKPVARVFAASKL